MSHIYAANHLILYYKVIKSMKYKRHKGLIYFAGISILLSLIGYYFVSKDIYPYELVQVSNVHCDREIESYLIEDLDDNGYSE